jgi:hypothetical protein
VYVLQIIVYAARICRIGRRQLGFRKLLNSLRYEVRDVAGRRQLRCLRLDEATKLAQIRVVLRVTVRTP